MCFAVITQTGLDFRLGQTRFFFFRDHCFSITIVVLDYLFFSINLIFQQIAETIHHLFGAFFCPITFFFLLPSGTGGRGLAGDTLHSVFCRMHRSGKGGRATADEERAPAFGRAVFWRKGTVSASYRGEFGGRYDRTTRGRGRRWGDIGHCWRTTRFGQNRGANTGWFQHEGEQDFFTMQIPHQRKL